MTQPHIQDFLQRFVTQFKETNIEMESLVVFGL